MFKEQTRFPKPQRTAIWNTEDTHRCCLRTGGQVKAKAICLPCWSSVCLTVITHTTVHMEQDSTAYNAICSCIYALQVKSPFYRCAQHLHSWQGGSLRQPPPPTKASHPTPRWMSTSELVDLAWLDCADAAHRKPFTLKEECLPPNAKRGETSKRFGSRTPTAPHLLAACSWGIHLTSLQSYKREG